MLITKEWKEVNFFHLVKEFVIFLVGLLQYFALLERSVEKAGNVPKDALRTPGSEWVEKLKLKNNGGFVIAWQLDVSLTQKTLEWCSPWKPKNASRCHRMAAKDYPTHINTVSWHWGGKRRKRLTCSISRSSCWMISSKHAWNRFWEKRDGTFVWHCLLAPPWIVMRATDYLRRDRKATRNVS